MWAPRFPGPCTSWKMPEVIVDIHPEWRGYRYFIVNDEVVIVEPDTLKIVAVIDV